MGCGDVGGGGGGSIANLQLIVELLINWHCVERKVRKDLISTSDFEL